MTATTGTAVTTATAPGTAPGAAPEAGPALLRCTGVTRSYGTVARVEALRAATFAIDDGEQVAICGPSGSGKSTLMNVLGLLDVPTSGTYELAGVDTSGLSEAERSGLRAQVIGFVFQAFHLLPTRTALENVELGLTYVGVGRRARRAAAAEVLDRVGLGHRARADIVHLSGGERQRVAVARAIAHRPRLLLADEPTGSLDSRNGEVVLGLLRELNDDGLAQVVVTHDEAVAAALPRRLDVFDGLVTEAERP